MSEKERISETVDWHKNSKELIEEFFDKEMYTSGYNNPNDKGTNFPRLNNHLIDIAITMDFLDYSMKDKILKDPNKLSIFFLKIDSQSPFTKQALIQLNLSSEKCKTLSFQEYYKYDEDPLKALVDYMIYLSNQYKLLQQVLHKRNHLKKNKLFEEKKYHKRLLKTMHENSSIYAEADTFLTLVPRQDSLDLLSGNKISMKSITSKTSNSNKSFRHNRSLDTLYLSIDQKLSNQKSKQIQLQNTYQKYIDNIEQKEMEFEQYYEKKKPFDEEKVKKIQELHTKYEIINRAYLIKLQANREKFNKTVAKIKEMNEKDLQKRKKYSEAIKKKQDIIDLNRKHHDETNKEKILEKEQEQQKKEEMRKQRRFLSKLIEQEQMQKIIERLEEKDKKLTLNLDIKLNQLNQKHQQNEIASNQAHTKMKSFREMKEKKNFEQFMINQESTTNQIEEYNRQKEQKQQDLEKKKQKLLQKVIQNKQKNEDQYQKRLQGYSQQYDDGKFQESQIHCQTDERLQQQIFKNKERLDKVMSQCAANLKEQEEKSQKIMDRILENNRRSLVLKKEQENLKEESIKQHFLTKQVMIDVIMGKKKSK